MNDYFMEKTIYYHDTDCGGVVYYANYLKFMEEARTQFCFSRGVDIRNLYEQGIFFVIAKVEIAYKAPARYLDNIRVYVKVDKLGRSSLDFTQEIKKDDKLLVTAKVTWVCVNRDFKPRSHPEEMKKLCEISG